MDEKYTANIEDEDVHAVTCHNCGGIVRWIPISQPNPDDQCERCNQLPSKLSKNRKHLDQVRQMRESGELGEQYLYCHYCENETCNCRRCSNCGYRNAGRYSRCANCDRSLEDSPLWYAAQQVAYCAECGAPEDDCHCDDDEEEDYEPEDGY